MGGKLGDSGAKLTWAMYHRWPLFASILGVIGGLFSGFLFGWIGLAAGLLAGGAVGGILGLLMGIDRNMFPVQIVKWIGYGGGEPTIDAKYPGRVVTNRFESGSTFVERRVVEYLDGMVMRQLPNFSLPVWYKHGETKKLNVLQVDSFTHLPIIWSRGALMAENVPIYNRVVRTGQDGKKFYDAERNEAGEPIVTGTTRQVIIDTNLMAEDDKVVQIPKGLAAKMDNERVQYTQAYRIATDFNKTGDFWQKYGQILTTIIGVSAILLIVIFGLIKFGEIAEQMSGKANAAMLAASATNLEATRLNAQIASALLKVGFNYNASYLTAAPTPEAPPVPSGGGGFQIPFVTG